MPENDKRKESAKIGFTASKKLTLYLYDIIDAEGYGNTPCTVVQNLMWLKINEMIDKGVIRPRHGRTIGDPGEQEEK